MIKQAVIIPGAICAIFLSFSLHAQDENYTHVRDDLRSGAEL